MKKNKKKLTLYLNQIIKVDQTYKNITFWIIMKICQIEILDQQKCVKVDIVNTCNPDFLILILKKIAL